MITTTPYRWLIVLLAGLILTACDKQEPFPVYLQLEAPQVTQAHGGSFATTKGIKDLWIEHNENNLGVYRVPRVVPLLPEEDRNQLAVFGGVFENGLSAFRLRYPFWQPNILELSDLVPGDTIPMNFNFEYYPDTVLAYPLNEGFEGASFAFDNQTLSPNSTVMVSTRTDAFQGNGCAKVSFNASQNDFEIISSEAFFLPQRGTNDIYIEIAYKNDVSFTAGLYYITQGLDAGELSTGVFFNTQMEEWNIAYLHVNDQVRETPENAVFRLYIRANSGDQSGTLLLDNIRIVHFR